MTTATAERPSATLRLRGVVSQAVQAIAKPSASEVFVFGTRGDGKTIGALAGMIAHARIHAEAGFELPTIWMGFTDTHQSHKAKAVPTMQERIWEGGWRIRDDSHIAEFVIDGTVWVRINLFGIEDLGAMDRVRAACHGVWGEEMAPAAVLVSSSGVGESAWLLAQTSRRLPTHGHVSIATLNYPDEDHWTWRRALGNPQQGLDPAPGVLAFRVPPGERASAADRAEWERALAGRPDLLRRLIAGEPGVVLMGQPVAVGYRTDRQLSAVPLAPMPHEPLFCGLDGGHTPTLVIGQEWRGQLRIFAALAEARGGMRQLMERQAVPWFTTHAPWALDQPETWILGGHDPNVDTDDESDIDQNPLKVVRSVLGGHWLPGPVSWEGRRGPLLTRLSKTDESGNPGLVLNGGHPGCQLLDKALSGRWYYKTNRLETTAKDQPHKPNHPWEDLGDATCYLIARVTPGARIKPPTPQNKNRAKSYAVR